MCPSGGCSEGQYEGDRGSTLGGKAPSGTTGPGGPSLLVIGTFHRTVDDETDKLQN